jgi:hypothetical protein
MTLKLDPKNNPDYEWSDELRRCKRKPSTHSGAKQLQREALRARKKAIERGEYVEPTTQNSFYYYLRKIFLANGINPAIEGKNFRKTITNQIDDICREWGTTREDLLIIADARATLYYNNQRYHVSLKNIQENQLYLRGTDVIIIEKAALCNLLAPLAAKAGIALIDTKGYVVEYAKKLSDLALEYGGHVAMITDFDSDGLLMSLDVYDNVSRDIYRIGIDFETIYELKQMYPELSEELSLEILEEPYKPSHSFKRLDRLAFYGKEERRIYQKSLPYLKHNRIEIDSVQRVVGYQKLWAFILKKLEERFPERDYNRAIQIPIRVLLEIYLRLGDLLDNMMKPELGILKQEIRASLEDFKGFLDNVSDNEKGIKEYFREEMQKSSNLIDILNKIKDIIDQFKQELNIKSFMESIF